MRRVLLSIILALLLISPLPVAGEDWSALAARISQQHMVQVLTDEGSCAGMKVGDKLFLTAAHCVGSNLYLKTANDSSTPQLLASDQKLDLALYSSTLMGKQPIKFAPASPPVGTAVLALGYPGGFLHVTSSNIMTLLRGYVVTDQAHQYGYSGGPLVNLKGELVGMNSATNFMWQRGYSISVEYIRVFVEMVRVGMLSNE